LEEGVDGAEKVLVDFPTVQTLLLEIRHIGTENIREWTMAEMCMIEGVWIRCPTF